MVVESDSKSNPHINARAETVHALRMFKEAFAKRRALVPIAVSRSVNSVKNDDESCIQPIGEPPLAV